MPTMGQSTSSRLSNINIHLLLEGTAESLRIDSAFQSNQYKTCNIYHVQKKADSAMMMGALPDMVIWDQFELMNPER